MIFDTTSMALQLLLDGAVSTTALDCHAWFRVWNDAGEETKPTLQRSTVSSATAVTAVSAPAQPNYVRECYGLAVYNRDVSTQTVTVRTNNSTSHIIIKQTLTTSQALFWEKNVGWYVK